MNFSALITVEDILVRREVTETKFFCDLEKCKGACCTLESEFGAPLEENEIQKIDENLPEVLKFLSQKHKDEIELNGFYEKKDNQIMTRSVENRACVFVYFENEIAKCSIEKAYFEGKSNFRKPISCHLFPIRISNFGGEVVRYEKFKECAPALEKGKSENTTIAEFCKDSLKRKYGEKWYNKLLKESGK